MGNKVKDRKMGENDDLYSMMADTLGIKRQWVKMAYLDAKFKYRATFSDVWRWVWLEVQRLWYSGVGVWEPYTSTVKEDMKNVKEGVNSGK